MKNRTFIPLIFTLALFVLTITPAGTVSAQQPTPSDDQVNAIASQLFCPVCENTPLDVCPTEACHDWRELIRQMLAEGKSAAEIKNYFVEHYGARVLSAPPQTGFNWLVYVVPPVAFLAGVLLLFFAFRNWRRSARDIKTETIVDEEPAANNSYAARIEEELRKR